MASVDDPDGAEAIRLTNSNIDVVYDNYNNYLDIVNFESFLDEEDLPFYVEGIETHFPKLFAAIPPNRHAVTSMSRKAQLMRDKTKIPEVEQALDSLIENLTQAFMGSMK